MRVRNHFGPRTTLREVADASAGGRRVFDQVGLDYCCEANRTMAQACDEARAPLDAVLSALEREYRAARDPPRRGRERRSLRSLVHLAVRAHDRTHEMMQAIGEELDERAAWSPHDARLQELAAAFRVLRAEVEARMGREEREIFAPLDALSANGERSASPRSAARDLALGLALAREHHASVGVLLRRLRRAIGRCRGAELAGLRAQLDRFDHHLVHQVYVENEVLFRRALAALTEQQTAA